MKKILVFLLATVLICSSILLIACNDAVTGIKFKEDTLPQNVKQGDTINYDTIVIIATYEGGTTKEVKLTDKGVTFQKIDTSTTGNKVLLVSYMGQTTQTNVNVAAQEVVGKIIITGFVNTKGYLNYEEAKAEKSNKDEEFFNRNALYEVGNVNGYVLMPTVSGLDAENNEFDKLPDLKTTYVLYVKNGGSFVKVEQANLENYLSKVENNVYYFTEDAADHEFKLEVTLDDSYEVLDDKMSKTITQEFKIIGGGYNVYDALGLSVLDNLNIRSWADIKNTKLAWDDKKLSEYNDVELVILHNNITLTKSDLPANYFWTKNEAAKGKGVSYADALSRAPEQLKPLLEGSLKETCLGEDWENGSGNRQRGLFVSTGIGLSGNYLKLTYETGLIIAGDDKDAEVTAPNGGIYIVHDYTQETGKTVTYPESHTSLIAYRNTDKSAKVSVSISNVYFVGQTQKTENTKIPAGLMMAMTDIGNINYNNVIAQRWFANIMVSGYFADANVNECKFYNSFSHMIYAWYANTVNVTNSELKNAGGPLFILQSNVMHGDVLGNGTTDVEFKLNVDKFSMEHMESWLTGSEVWFKINTPEATSVIPQLFGLSAPMDKTLGKHYVQKEGSGDNEITKYNVLMVLIPSPSKVFDNQEPLVGKVTLDGQEYNMDDPVLACVQQLPAYAQELVNLITALQEQGVNNEDIQKLKAGAEKLKTQMAALPIAPIYKSGSNYAVTADTQNLIFVEIIAGVKQLQAGASSIASVLDGMGKSDPAAVFTAWAAKVNPIASLANADDISNVDTAWKEGWANAPKFAALWVNPGGLDAKNPNFSLKPFMVVFGENTQAQ